MNNFRALLVLISLVVAGCGDDAKNDSAGALIEHSLDFRPPETRQVAFSSGASNLVSGDTNEATDVFVHDAVSGVTRRVSVASGRRPGRQRQHLFRIHHGFHFRKWPVRRLLVPGGKPRARGYEPNSRHLRP